MKLTFEIYTEPHSFDAEDEIMNLLQDDGMMQSLATSVAVAIDRLYGIGSPRIMARYVSRNEQNRNASLTTNAQESATPCALGCYFNMGGECILTECVE